MAFMKAKENIEECFPNSEMLYTIYNNLGLVCRAMKDYDTALEYHKKALDIALSRYHDNYDKVGWAYGMIAENFIFMKRYQEAKTYLIKALRNVQPMYGDSHRKTQELYLSLGMAFYVLNDWQNIYTSLVKIIPRQQQELQKEVLDSAEYKKAMTNTDLLLSVTIKAMDSLNISDGKYEYLHELYDIKNALNKQDIGMFDIANELGMYYYDKDSIYEARKYFATAFEALRKSGNKSYRRNSICHNLYYTYMDLFSTEDSLRYKNEYINEYAPYIDVTLLIDEGGMHRQQKLVCMEDIIC